MHRLEPPWLWQHPERNGVSAMPSLAIPTISRNNTAGENIGNALMILFLVAGIVVMIIASTSQPSYTEQARDNYGLSAGKAYPATAPQQLGKTSGNLLESAYSTVHVGVTADNGQSYGLDVPLDRVTFDPRESGPVLATFTFGNGSRMLSQPLTLQDLIDADYGFGLKLTLTNAQYAQLMG